MSGTDFYYEPQVRLAEELAAIVPIDGDVRTFFAQLRHRGDRGGDQAVALLHEAAGHHRVPRRVPRPLARLAVADREQGDSAPRLRSASCRASITRRIPDTYRFNGSADACAAASLSFIRDQILVHLISPDEVAAIVVEPIQGEGGYIVPPTAFLQGLRELTTQHGMLLVVRRSAVGHGPHRQDVRRRALRSEGRHRQHREGHRVGPAARRHLRARGRHDVAARRARQHVRRQSGVVRGRATPRSSC